MCVYMCLYIYIYIPYNIIPLLTTVVCYCIT